MTPKAANSKAVVSRGPYSRHRLLQAAVQAFPADADLAGIANDFRLSIKTLEILRMRLADVAEWVVGGSHLPDEAVISRHLIRAEARVAVLRADIVIRKMEPDAPTNRGWIADLAAQIAGRPIPAEIVSDEVAKMGFAHPITREMGNSTRRKVKPRPNLPRRRPGPHLQVSDDELAAAIVRLDFDIRKRSPGYREVHRMLREKLNVIADVDRVRLVLNFLRYQRKQAQKRRLRLPPFSTTKKRPK
jgi:hypothetical protein